MIKGRYTPWDESALKMRTFEIQEIDYENIENCLNDLKENSFCQADLIYGRFPAKDLKIKELLLRSGYFPCETSFKVTLGKLNDYSLPKVYVRRKISVVEIEKEDYGRVAEIAYDMFNFTRFHEDPLIPRELSDNRIHQWVNDLANQDVACLVNMSSFGGIVSFMIYKVDDKNKAELILGGSKKGFELHSPFFWGSVIDYLKNKGITRITTTISAANSGVLSLYQDLGFKIIETNTDYHKHT